MENKIEFLDEKVVSKQIEKILKVSINNKIVSVSVWSQFDEYNCDSGVDILEGKENLTEEEEEAIYEGIDQI